MSFELTSTRPAGLPIDEVIVDLNVVGHGPERQAQYLKELTAAR